MPDSNEPINQATINDPKQQRRDDARYSPGAGCVIFALMLALFFGAIIGGLFVGSRVDKDMSKFTEKKPLSLPNQPGTTEEVNAVREKIETFKKTIREKQPATLDLTVRDLNILIHNDSAFIEIRDMIYFEEITPELITGRLSMPVNRFPPWKPQRYVNGTITMALEVSPGRLFLRLQNIESPDKTIEPGFIERIAQDDLLDPYKTDDSADIFASIQTATLNNGSVTIQSNPVEFNRESK